MQRLLTKREKLIFFATLGAIIFGVSFNFLLGPVLTKNDMLSKEIETTRARLKRYMELLGRKEYIQAKFDRYSAKVSAPGQKEDAIVRVLSELEHMAQDAGIRVVDIRPQALPRTTGRYKENLIDLKTEGKTEGFLKFLYDIENSFLLLKIKRFQLNAKPSSPFLEGIFSISQLVVE